jgi:hypothetical protein
MKAEILVEHGMHKKGSVHDYVLKSDGYGTIRVEIKILEHYKYYWYLKGEYILIEEPKAENKTEQTYVEHFLKELKDRGINEDAIIRLYHLDPMVHNNSINFNQLSLEQADTILKEIRR